MDTSTPHAGDNIIRVSVSEAARLFGVSSKTIRQALKNEELRYIVVNGRYKINFLSLVEWSQQSTRRRNQLSKAGIGQYIGYWRITNKKFSPNPKLAIQKKDSTPKPIIKDNTKQSENAKANNQNNLENRLSDLSL